MSQSRDFQELQAELAWRLGVWDLQGTLTTAPTHTAAPPRHTGHDRGSGGSRYAAGSQTPAGAAARGVSDPGGPSRGPSPAPPYTMLTPHPQEGGSRAAQANAGLGVGIGQAGSQWGAGGGGGIASLHAAGFHGAIVSCLSALQQGDQQQFTSVVSNATTGKSCILASCLAGTMPCQTRSRRPCWSCKVSM